MLKEMQEALIAGRKADVEALVDKALAAGMPAGTILNEGLIPGMERLGVQFKNNEVFIPEVLVAARARTPGWPSSNPIWPRPGSSPAASSSSGRSRATSTTSARTSWP